jgi:hypothetical protein
VKKLLTRDNLKTGATGLGGMIVGAVVGIAVQVGVESTGMLGPSVDELLNEQKENFEEVNARLDRLRSSTKDPELNREIAQLASLLQRQDKLRQQASTELTLLNDQVASLRHQSLEEQGFSGGADVWLKAGESISVGDDRNSFGVTRIWSTAVDVNLNGEKSRMAAGDSVSTEQCQVFFKQPVRQQDGRVGFDVACD